MSASRRAILIFRFNERGQALIAGRIMVMMLLILRQQLN